MRAVATDHGRVRMPLSGDVGWGEFWEFVRTNLERRGFAQSTIIIYRHVLRQFYRYSRSQSWLSEARPFPIQPRQVERFLNQLVARGSSWSWISTNISVIRTAFDKLAGLHVTERLRTPKRPKRLPVVITRDEAIRVLEAAPSTRDKLLLALLYGCGLKVGEACKMRWSDLDVHRGTVRVVSYHGKLRREVMLPKRIMSLLREGIKRCRPADYIFRGREDGAHLSVRMVEIIVSQAVRKSGVSKPITGMTLRHSYAVHMLMRGATIREVQEALGHKSIETTLIYEKCMLPEDAVSPLDDELLEEELSVQNLELPFAPDLPKSTAELALEYYYLLKTRVNDRFLAVHGPP